MTPDYVVAVVILMRIGVVLVFFGNEISGRFRK